MTKVHSGLKSFSPPSTLSSLPRSHSRQRSTTPTLMRRARCACLWSVQRTGSLPPKLTKVGAEVLHRAARCESQRAGELHIFWFLSDVMIAGKKKSVSKIKRCPVSVTVRLSGSEHFHIELRVTNGAESVFYAHAWLCDQNTVFSMFCIYWTAQL